MPKYQIIAPEGTLILRDPETGRTLRLTSASGPLVLGAAELTLTLDAGALQGMLAGAPAEGAQGGAPSGAPQAASRQASPPEPAPRTPREMPDDVARALERLAAMPPGFGPDREVPFLSPDEPVAPPDPGAAAPELPPERTLDAPLEALTEPEFAASLSALMRARDEVAGELEYLREIEADPMDVEDLERRRDALEERFAAVARRHDAWERLQRRIDEERGL